MNGVFLRSMHKKGWHWTRQWTRVIWRSGVGQKRKRMDANC